MFLHLCLQSGSPGQRHGLGWKILPELNSTNFGAPAASANEEAYDVLTADILLAVLCTCCYVNLMVLV